MTTSFWHMTSPDSHDWILIGKRSFAGWYCWDCGVLIGLNVSCPTCGTPNDTNAFFKLACSFTWAIEPQDGWEKLAPTEDKVISDGGTTYTVVEFFEMLSRMCPPDLWNTRYVGMELV